MNEARIPVLMCDSRLPNRFWDKISPEPTTGCWLWTGSKSGDYAAYRHEERTRVAHVVAFETTVGEVGEGLELDHLCRTTMCVNPNHLEPVTHVENMRRGTSPVSMNMHKTHCKRGHEFPVGPYTLPVGGRRYCVPCKLERQRKAYVPRPRPPQTHCKRGHEYNEENTGSGNGRRRCRKCVRDQMREAYRNKKRKDDENDR